MTRPHPIAWALVALVAAAAWALDAWLLCLALHVPVGSRWGIVGALALCPVAYMAQGTDAKAGAAARAALALAVGVFVALMGLSFISVVLTTTSHGGM